MAKQKIVPKRSDVEKQYTWATEDIFASDELFFEALEELRSMPDRVASYRGRLAESAETLHEYLVLSDEIKTKINRLGMYAMRKADEDTANSFYQGMKGSLISFYVQLASASSFDTPEINAIEDGVLEGFYKTKPELEGYRRLLE